MEEVMASMKDFEIIVSEDIKNKSSETDREFLKQGNVFTDDQIDAYIALKFEEIYNLEHTPHPIEFQMYYSS